jgi:hypothetical protein
MADCVCQIAIREPRIIKSKKLKPHSNYKKKGPLYVIKFRYGLR